MIQTKLQIEIQKYLEGKKGAEDVDIYRNKWRYVVAAIWYDELKNMDNLKLTNILKMFRDGFLSDPEQIRRLWQKAQEKNPELRGSEWYLRQKKAGRIRKTIHNL